MVMSKDKIKDFQEFIKQDFDIFKDYKNASKELTAKEVWIKILNTDEKVNGQWTPQVKTMLQDGDILFISKTLDKIATLEKRDTPMDAQVEGLIEEWEQYIEQDNCGGTAKEALVCCVQDLKSLLKGNDDET